MINLPTTLENDSEDLSIKETESAIIVANVDNMIAHLNKIRCHQCKQRTLIISHALRRQTPFLYGRVDLCCMEEHHQTIVFRMDWL